MNKLNVLALSALLLNLLGYIPKFGHFFSLAGFIVSTMVYRQLESIGLIKSAWKLFVSITLLSLLAVMIALVGYIYQDNHMLLIITSVVAYLVGLIVAGLTYKLSERLMFTVSQTRQKSFRVTAVMFKIAAFTMPVLVGFLIQGLAQLVFLIATIMYKPDQIIKD